MTETFAGFLHDEIEGIPVLWKHDPRFKTFRMSLHFRRPLEDAAVAAARSLLPSLLMQGTERDPDRPAIARRMESLYGAGVAPDTLKLGESHVLRFSLDSVDGGYLPGNPDLFSKGLAFLADFLARPRLDDGHFPVEIFELEQRQVIDYIRSIFDDKGGYALQEAIRNACQGEPFAIPEYGSETAVSSLDAKAPEAARQDFLEHGEVWALAMGSLPSAGMQEQISGFLSQLPRRAPEAIGPPVSCEPRDCGSTVERVDLQQSKMILIYRIPWCDDSRTWMARALFASMLGGGPASRLFRELREKKSLCYYAQASMERHKGLLILQAGLDESDAEGAREAACLQMTDMQAGNFTEEELETARAGVLSSLASVDDSVGRHMEYVSNQWLLGQDRTVIEQTEIYAAITADEIRSAVDGIWLDHCYLLAGSDQEGGS
ncbi:MAG: pitrilysin family protein [Planctomycetota bacterium]|nr:pitrilysin family protein [Planctomycetota bacterium]